MICFLSCCGVGCDLGSCREWVAEDVVQSGGGLCAVVGSPGFLSGLRLWNGVQLCLFYKLSV